MIVVALGVTGRETPRDGFSCRSHQLPPQHCRFTRPGPNSRPRKPHLQDIRFAASVGFPLWVRHVGLGLSPRIWGPSPRAARVRLARAQQFRLALHRRFGPQGFRRPTCICAGQFRRCLPGLEQRTLIEGATHRHGALCYRRQRPPTCVFYALVIVAHHSNSPAVCRLPAQ